MLAIVGTQLALAKRYAYSDGADGDWTNHRYLTQGGKVIRETIGTGSTARVLDFIYNESGRPFAVKDSQDGGSTFATYYYVLNLQGDVVKLIGASGTVYANYKYNAWGELLSVTNASGNAITNYSHISHVNPLRYRGYYYDFETGWYYLQSRYYDPVLHRFINADSYTYTGQGFIGANMFAYCGNNPVCRTDHSGQRAVGFWSFDYDEQGLEILLHWLYGNGEPLTFNGGEWGTYMRSNKTLQSKLNNRIEAIASYMTSGTIIKVDFAMSMEIENGEDIIGYQYLHGTNSDVGDFHIAGTIQKTKYGEVLYSLQCTWNDIIDPNLIYNSDKKKARFAELIPGATPTDYNISISWLYTNTSLGGASGGGCTTRAVCLPY